MFQKLFAPLLLFLWLSACNKKDNHSQPGDTIMDYVELGDREVKYGQPATIDLDGNGATELIFTTQLSGDPILEQDRLQFRVISGSGTSIYVIPEEETPVWQRGERIGSGYAGLNWSTATRAQLAEKIISLYGSTRWAGRWKDVRNGFLPVRIIRNGEYHFGWIQLSFDISGDRLLLHRAAISRDPGKPVWAGF